MATTDVDLDTLVDRTPVDRDRIIDAARAGCIAVVVLWHWVFSVIHWGNGGRLTMPNPIDQIPGGFALTWVLQVMPLFFAIGGFANLAALDSPRMTVTSYLGSRSRRLLLPLLPMVVGWLAIDLATPGNSVLHWGWVVFVPLWFIATYAVVVTAAPLTAAFHRRAPLATLAILAGTAVGLDWLRFAHGFTAAPLSAAAVFLLVHQLGYFWRDGWFTNRGPFVAAVAVGGLCGLIILGPYPASMVATRSAEVSNMQPPGIPIALVGLLQVAALVTADAPLRRLLERRSVWRAVIGANALAMPVFAWHMTALVGFVGVWSLVGLELAHTPDQTWWLARPLWLLGPGFLLVGILGTGATLRRLTSRSHR